jgi:outer membrane protein OmpA-like peptidoglycan-associated protein
MTLRAFRLLAVPALLLVCGQAAAQGTLSEGAILNSLAGAGEAAQAVGLDVPAIKADIEKRIRVEGTENAAAPPPALQALAMLPNLTVEIQFDFDSDRIMPRSYYTVGRIADALHHPQLLGFKFAVVGHTDAKGKREYNLKLSQRRADAVVEALTTTFRVDGSQLVALGLGEEQPQDASSPDGAVNRRVQLLNLGPR